MKLRPISQTRFGRGGNCLAACIATLAGCDLDLVDFSASDCPESWDEVACMKLWPLGLTYLYMTGHGLSLWVRNVGYIVHGDTPRGLNHAVVFFNDRLIHDPHPGGTGVTNITGVSFVLPLMEI